MENSTVKLRVMLVEDHALLRIGLKILLEQLGIDIVAEAENGEEAVALCLTEKPEVVLMDLSMPVMDGIEAARRIREVDPAVKVIMLTSHDNEEHIHASLAAGANGYCLKETKPERLITALHAVRQGDLWLDSHIAAKALRSVGSGAINGDDKVNPNKLTPMDLEVLHLIVEGMTVCEIATKLKHSEQAIKEVEFRILEKLAASERTQSALQALRQGTSKTRLKKVQTCCMCRREFEEQFVCCPFDGTQLDHIVSDDLTGTVFADRYEILQRLGSGGMSIVYKARHKLLGRVVAIKLLDPLLITDLQNAKRFREEARASSLMNHTNLINIFDFGLTPTGDPYLVMDYIDGVSLSEIILHHKRVEADDVIGIFTQACEGLEHAHSKGVVHRDIKPSNIMLMQDDHVKIIDFGIAKVFTSAPERIDLTQKGEILGSPTYMSPEQCLGKEMDARSDIYSLGVAMYEALTGQLPFFGATAVETMHMHMSASPMPMTGRFPGIGIPGELDRIVMKMLNKDPKHRYQTAREVQQALLAVGRTTACAVPA
ncbi:MAG TPA: protein kinase [Planktothrix sp.]|jgi:serine/threonine-protein kinase